MNYNDALEYSVNRLTALNVFEKHDENFGWETAKYGAEMIWKEPGFHEPPYELLRAYLEAATLVPFMWKTCAGIVDCYRNEPMPDILHDFLNKVLRGEIKQPVIRGRDSLENSHRDFVIIETIAELRKKGFNPTRNEYSQSVSACDVVADAITKLGMEMSYDGVCRIWKSRPKKLIP